MTLTNKRTAPNLSILGLVYQIPQTRHGHEMRDAGLCEAEPKSTHAHASDNEDLSWSRNREVQEYPIDEEGLLFHPVLQLLCHLNETAMFIWRQCEGLSTHALIEKLAEHFGVETTTARRHVIKTLDLFSVSGFVASENSGASTS